MTPGLGVPLHPKDVSLGDLGGHQRPPSSLRVFPLAPRIRGGRDPQAHQTTLKGPHKPWGARPFPRDIGLRQPVPTWDLVRLVPGASWHWDHPPALAAGAGDHRQWPLHEPKPCPSVHPSAASWHCCGVLAQLMVGTMPCTGGTPGLSHSGTGLGGVGVCSGEGSDPAPTARHSPGTHSVGEGLAGVRGSAQPESPGFGEHSPTAGSCPNGCPGWVFASGMSWGETEESPAPAVPALGPPPAHLPPISGCFSSRAPDLPGICCNLAGSAPWPAGTARRMRPRCGREPGLRVGG